MKKLLLLLDNMKLQTRISLLVFLGLAAVLGLLTLVSVRVVRATTDEIVQERLVIAKMTASYVDTMLDEAHQELSSATTFASFDPQTSDLVEERQVMRYTFAHVGDFTQGLILLDPQGKVLLTEPPNLVPAGSDLASEPFAKQAMGTTESKISNTFLFGPTGKPAVAITIPVKNSAGQVVSILCELIDLKNPRFAELLQHSTQLGKTGHADIVDANNKVVASSDSFDVLLPVEHPDFYRRMLQAREPGVETTNHDEGGVPDGRHVMAFAPLKSAPWGIGLGASEQETFAPIRQEQIQSGILAALSIIAALILAWFSTRRVVRPVEALIGAAERMASGDLASPIIAKGGGDEVGKLAATFDEMRLKLQAAYHALTVEKSQYQGIFRFMADPVFTVDTELRVTSLNPAAERMIGCPAAEVLGLHCHDILQSREHEAAPSCRPSCPLLPSTDWEKTSRSTVEAVATRQGSKVPVEVTRAPIFNDDGELVGAVHVLRDISAQEELDRVKEQFLSNVSHELRSPLGFVKGYATTLLRKDAEWQERTRRKFLREILGASEQLQRLVDEILDMSRMQAGTFTVEPQPAQIKPIVNAAVKWVKAEPHNHKFVVSLPQDLPWVLVDPQRTEQLLRNLLENAVKYSPEGSSISVQGHVEGEAVILSVADEGIGIAAERLEQIFERFHRVDSELASRVGGVGLGLSICRSIAEAQGGRIWAESRVPSGRGKGSTFHFSMPIFEKD